VEKIKAMLFEVAVECEGSSRIMTAHHFKAGAVNQAQAAPRCGQPCGDGGVMCFRVKPVQIQ